MKSDSSFLDQWQALLPDEKLELIDGQLMLGSLAGSRRMLWMLLREYGPRLALPMASATHWMAALKQTYHLDLSAHEPSEWHTWSEAAQYEPTQPPLDPSHDRWNRWKVLSSLRWGLWHFGTETGHGLPLGPDFVLRLDDHALTPDGMLLTKADQEGATYYDRYLEGTPSLLIELVSESSREMYYGFKKELYVRHRVPEFWFIDVDRPQVTFFRRVDDRYEERTVDHASLQRIIETKEDKLYRAQRVPHLSVSLLKLFTTARYDHSDPWGPFVPTETREVPLTRPQKGGVDWDDVPFLPTPSLAPVRIRFDEFAAWCGRAKFERYAGGTKIDGYEGTRRLVGMLLMTLGLEETVRMLHPREWVAFLDPLPYRAEQEKRTAYWMQRATYDTYRINEAVRHTGKVPGVPDVDGHGDTREACQADLHRSVAEWVLLKIVRGIPREVSDIHPYRTA